MLPICWQTPTCRSRAKWPAPALGRLLWVRHLLGHGGRRSRRRVGAGRDVIQCSIACGEGKWGRPRKQRKHKEGGQ